MRHFLPSRFLIVFFIFFFLNEENIFALTYPTTTPSGETYGGTYYGYFTNIFSSETNCNGAGKVVGGFKSDGTPICVSPGIASSFMIPGSVSGDTLRYDGTDWIHTGLIYNDGVQIGIGTNTPGALLDVNADILINGLTLGRGGGNILSNTVNGVSAFLNNLSGIGNTTLGGNALFSNISGSANTSLGWGSLKSNISGSSNTSIGYGSLFINQGSSNVAFGDHAGSSLQNGDNNVLIGTNAGVAGAYNLSSGSLNIAIGPNTGFPNAYGSNQLNIGNLIFGNGLDGSISSPQGNVGIGTSSPSAKLEVAGQIKINDGTQGSGKVLTSDSSGLASWTTPFASTMSATGILGGTQNYISKFGTGGTGLYSSQIFDDGTNIGISTASPLFKFDVNGDGRFVGNLTVSGSLFVDKIVNRSVNNISISGSLLPDIGAPQIYRDIGSNSQRWNNLYLSGQLLIAGGSPGVGKILTSDANGLASWGNTALFVTATGITGGTQNYISKFGTGGTGLYSSQIFDDGTNIGIGNATPTSKLEIWSGATTLLHFRGVNNIGVGIGAVKYSLTGNANTGIGGESLFTVTTGYSNSAFGYRSLRQTTSGFNNSAFGQEALFNNNGGNWNNAVGYQALYSNVSGVDNVAEGPQALYNLSTGNNNVAIGYQSIRAVAGSSVSGNVGIGYQSLYSTTSSNQVAIGYQSLYLNTTGISNTALGYQTLDANISGSNNTAIGDASLGGTTGSNNTALGSSAGSGITSGSNNIAIGYAVQLPSPTSSNQLNIGNWIYGSGGNIGIGLQNPSVKFELNSGVSNLSGMKFTQLTSSSPLYTSGATNPLGVDASGNVVPVQGGAIPVYTAIGSSPSAAINVSTSPPTIGADYDKYFTIPARQSFVVTDVSGQPANAPNMAVGAASNKCTGSSGTCISPWATYVMTAQNGITGTRYAYQILISDRTDAPFIVRGGTYNGTTVVGNGGSASLWFKAITVPTNHSDWFYINPGVDNNNVPQSGGGNVGIGTITPSSLLNIVSSAGGITSLTSTGASLGLGAYNSTNILFDENTIQSKSSASASGPLYVNSYGGGVNIGGTSVPSSTLEVNGTFKLGSAGTSTTGLGVCTIASTAISTTATSYTCTGVPASTSVSVSCSAAAAFTTPNTTSLYCRANGTADKVTCNTTVANSVSTTYKCMWMQ